MPCCPTARWCPRCNALDAGRSRRAWAFGPALGAPVTGIKPLPDGSVEVDAGVAEVFDLAVIAEGGVFADGAQKVAVSEHTRAPLTHDYAQTAWVGTVHLHDSDTAPVQSVAVERFTRHGPAALLPLPAQRRRATPRRHRLVRAHRHRPRA